MKTTKGISVSKEVYEFVQSQGKFGESFSQVLARLLGIKKQENHENQNKTQKV